MIHYLSKHLMCILTVCCLLTYGLVYMGGSFAEPIRSDGLSYHAYLPAILIDGDLSFETLANLRFNGEVPGWMGFAKSARTGRWVNKYGVGVSLLLTPFFVVAHLLTYVFHSPASWHRLNYAPDGWSFFYQHLTGLGGMFYGLWGVVLLRNSLRRYFPEHVVVTTLLALFFGTNLFHYLSGETVLSHPYSFFLFAYLLYLLPRIFNEEPRTRDFVLLGLCVGLLAAVRLTNLIMLVVVVLYNVVSRKDVKLRCLFILRNWQRLAFAVLAAGIAFFPQILIWRYASGRWCINPYKEVLQEGFFWITPQWLDVLISLRGGVLFWSPVLVWAILGYVPFRRACPALFWPSIAFIIPFTALIACWRDWAFGGGFGHRGFVEAYVLLAFPMAAFFQRVAEAKSRWVPWAVGLLTMMLIAYSLFFQMLYYTRELSIYGLDRQALFDILWWRKQRLETWWHMLFH